MRHTIEATSSWEVHSPVFVIPKLQEDRLVADCGQEIVSIIVPGEYGPLLGIISASNKERLVPIIFIIEFYNVIYYRIVANNI